MIYTLKQFIDYVNMVDCLNTTMPAYTVSKRKYSVTKRKAVQKRISEVQIDERGVPLEVIKQKLITKEVHDTNGIIYVTFTVQVQYVGFQARENIARELDLFQVQIKE